jgi:hypothetical protein
MTMPDDRRTTIKAAVHNTIGGSAEVTIRSVVHVDGGAHDIDHALHGVVDFATDRCVLDDDRKRARDGRGVLVFAGADSYQQLDDGRWLAMHGAPGTRHLMHPRAILDALDVAFRATIELEAGQVAIELDHDALSSLLDTGLGRGVSVRAVIADHEASISRVTLEFTDAAETTPYMQLTVDLAPSPDHVSIALPPRHMTLSADEHARELGP